MSGPGRGGGARGLRRARTSLPPGTPSLRAPLPAGTPGGVLAVLAAGGGVRVDPGAPEFRADRPVLVGRHQLEVDVPIAPGDREVARIQADLSFDGRSWHLRNRGPLPLLLPARSLLAHQSTPLAAGYLPLHLSTRAGRWYDVEVRVARDREPPAPEAVSATVEGRLVTVGESLPLPPLSPTDRLVLVVLARRYLADEADPAPLPWAQVADELAELAPDRGWTRRVVENRVRRLRDVLSRAGVPGLRAEELVPPLGNRVNENLVLALLARRMITPDDLHRFGLTDHGRPGLR